MLAAGSVGRIPSEMLLWTETAPIMNKDITAAEGFINAGNFNPPTKSKSAKIILTIPTEIITESLSP